MAEVGRADGRTQPQHDPVGAALHKGTMARLVGMVDQQRREIEALRGDARRGAQARGARSLPYRFDAYDKAFDASGYEAQGPRHRRCKGALRVVLQKERRVGEWFVMGPKQLAVTLDCSERTAQTRLRELEELGDVEVRRGTGHAQTVVRVRHPVKTLLSLEEIPWAAGGLLGAPEGYLDEIPSARRRYLELYGVELPPTPREATSREDASSREAGEGGNGPAGGSADEGGRESCAPGVKDLRPIETGEAPYGGTSLPSDARGGEEGPGRKDGKDGARARISAIEKELKATSPSEVGEEADNEARRVLDALGVRDATTAARAGQLAAYALRRGERRLLREASKHIRSARDGGVRIVSPIRYAIAALLDVREKTALTPEEEELGRRVLAEESPGPQEADDRGRRSADDRKRGYQWLFCERPEGFREGYESFDTAPRAEGPDAVGPEHGDGDGAEGPETGPDPEELRRHEERRRGTERVAREKARRDRERVARLFRGEGRLGEDMRRLAARVREGRLPKPTLVQRVALELEPGDPSAVARYWAAVEDELERGEE